MCNDDLGDPDDLDGHVCAPAERVGPHPLYIRHRFDDTRPDVLGPPDGLCTVLDDDGALCGRPYGEHLS